jgi:hypothetical protein
VQAAAPSLSGSRYFGAAAAKKVFDFGQAQYLVFKLQAATCGVNLTDLV